MGRPVDIADLIDAAEVANMLGLAQRNTVSGYQRRYPEMPRPLLDLGQGRPRLWSRAQIVSWMEHRGRATVARAPGRH